MTLELPRLDLDRHRSVIDARLSRLEAEVYRSLHGMGDACDALAAEADGLGLTDQAIRARLLASSVLSRLGRAAAGRSLQIALYTAAQAWPALAARAAMLLVSSCDRLGLRVEAMQWVKTSIGTAPGTEMSAWHAEALMVAAMMSVSRNGADYTLVDQALSAVRSACSPTVQAATAANFAEKAAECGELIYASHCADMAEATMQRHPEAASALSWESVARARLAAGEPAASEHAVGEALRLEETLGCCDVNGDPWLTAAEVKLARGDPDAALAMLEHPRRAGADAISAWTNTRDLHVRSKVLAALQRWEEAYQRLVQHLAAYERTRSIEGDRAVAESMAVVAVEEERRRSRHFEQLSLTDPLTGLPNRRHAERWLIENAAANAPGEAGAGDAAASANQLCVAIADLDHFKRINDTFSHDAGDLVLQRVSAILLDIFGTHAGSPAMPTLAARLGGEEFLLAWTGISVEGAVQRSNALCERLRQTSFVDIVGGMPVTASIGLVCAVRPADPGRMLSAADQCLYEAKRAGRDRVVSAALR
ncbi:MAG: diguanylate cyclase [Burkholderiales bacterium]